MPKTTARPKRRESRGAVRGQRGKRRSPAGLVAEAGPGDPIPTRVPRPVKERPGQDAKLRSGDPDVSPLEAAQVGEEVPGGSLQTPDQADVDDAGRVYGVQEEDSGALRTSSELLDRRDEDRAHQERPPRRRE